MRSRGIVLPANGRPVTGSMICTGRPEASRLCEKLPERSSAVGINAGCVTRVVVGQALESHEDVESILQARNLDRPAERARADARCSSRACGTGVPVSEYGLASQTELLKRPPIIPL